MNPIPEELVHGAEAFKRVLVKVDCHVEATPEDASDFDFLGSSRIVMAEFTRLSGEEAIGFLIALGDFLTLLKGSGVPYDDFDVQGLRQWAGAAGPSTAVSGEVSK